MKVLFKKLKYKILFIYIFSTNLQENLFYESFSMRMTFLKIHIILWTNSHVAKPYYYR